MRISEIIALKDVGEMCNILLNDNIEERNIPLYLKQFKGKHLILSRPDKVVGSAPEVLPNGQITRDTRKLVHQSKLVLRFQKKIVNSAVAFLFGKPVKPILNNQTDQNEPYFTAFMQILKDNKIDSFNKKLCRAVKSESKAAELWYFLPIVEYDANGEEILVETKIKSRILSQKNGDEIYAHYDDYGDLDAITRKYYLKDLKNRSIEHVDIYTSDRIFYNTKSISGNSYSVENKPTILGKIPIVFYDQEEPEWLEVQTLIDRVEMLISKLADTNDYFSAPSIVSKGEIESAPSKDEMGKFFELKPIMGTDGKPSFGALEYLTWDQTPESLKLELETLLQFIYSMTDTADVSFNNLKNLGVNMSGIAIKLMFLGSILKSYIGQELFGEGLTRRTNIIKAMMKTTTEELVAKRIIDDMDITWEFSSILPENTQEIIESLANSRPGEKLISEETAAKHHPFVNDPVKEVERLEKEKGESYVPA